MKRDSMKIVAIGFAALLATPGVVAAQNCVDDGNSNTRSAELEFSLAAGRSDTRPQEERYQRALDKLEDNWAMDEVPVLSYLLAANAYVELRDLVGADSMLTMLVANEPACEEQAGRIRFNAWVSQYNRGIELLQAGDEAGALTAFETANSINRDARSLAYAGSIHQTNGRNAEAIELYEAALEAGGQDEIVRTASINLASLKKDAGDTQGALAIYEQYSATNPDDILGQLNFAIALMDADRQPEAEAIFGEMLARDDLTFNQWSQVGIGLYRAQNFEQSAVAFERAHELNPYNKETLENLANSYYQSESFTELLPYAETLAERYPLERVPYNLLANSRRELGDPEAALAVLEKRDGLSIEFLRAQLAPTSETTYRVDGQVMNRTGAAGSTIVIPVTLIDDTGADVMTESLELTLPAESEVAAFALQFETDAPVAGFRYGTPGS